MNTFHAIIYLMTLHSTLQAAINNTEQEKELNEETDINISKFNNAIIEYFCCVRNRQLLKVVDYLYR
jgi:hypothetical protein